VRRKIIPIVVIVLVVGADAACAAAPVANGDPWERFNRRNYTINAWLDRHIIRPLAFLIHGPTQGVVGRGIHNITSNLKEPVVILNDLLQIRPVAAFKAVFRLATNSTLGVLGAVDVAVKLHVPHHPNGFGDTLGRYGIGPGPYLYLPLLGPSDPRDLFGAGVDAASAPMTWLRYPYKTIVSTSVGVVGGLNERAEADEDLKALLADAADPYATLRSTYLQARQGEIDDKHVLPTALPDLGDPATPPAPNVPIQADPSVGGPIASPDQPHAFLALPDQQGGKAHHDVAATLEQGQGQGKLGAEAKDRADQSVGAFLNTYAHGGQEGGAAYGADQALDRQH